MCCHNNTIVWLSTSSGCLYKEKQGNHSQYVKKKKSMLLKKCKRIISIPFNAIYTSYPERALGGIFPVFKVLPIYKGTVINYVSNSEPRDLSKK